MTQSSRPQNEDRDLGYSDSGRYSAGEWAQMLNALLVGDDGGAAPGYRYSRGVFASALNRLAVTNPAGTTIRVDTGASMVNGRFHLSDALTDFAPPAPAANPRVDVVVVVENNTGAVYSTNLIFPTVLTDYDGLASVPAYTARLAILQGQEAGAPVPRVLVQTADHFMIPLAQYEISIAPAITVGPTDMRAYVDQLVYRYGDATPWYTPVPALGNRDHVFDEEVLIQLGQTAAIDMNGVLVNTATVTFPTPFEEIPLVYLTVADTVPDFAANDGLSVHLTNVSTTQFTCKVRAFLAAGYANTIGIATTTIVNWLAIGPKT